MNARTLPALLAILLSLALSACGNKGPLVLPDPDAAEAVQDDGIDEADEAPAVDADEGDPAGDGGR